MTASARNARKRVLHLPKPVADSLSRDGESATVRWPAACLLLRRATRGRRPQSPGNQSRRARFWEFPPGDSLSRIAGDR